MNVTIIGAGAIGGHIAAKLAAVGESVTVVARGAHLKAIRDRGLTLKEDGEEIVARQSWRQLARRRHGGVTVRVDHLQHALGEMLPTGRFARPVADELDDGRPAAEAGTSYMIQ